LQHVLQHGKPEEHSTIITQLAGQIVKMSQQKFASNVVEKCLTFGTPEQRQILINEMLGTTDENVPLQVCFQQSVRACKFFSAKHFWYSKGRRTIAKSLVIILNS